MSDDNKQLYTATFTLSQEGLDGDIQSRIEFDPKIVPATEDMSDVPPSYEIMSNLVLGYLSMAGIVDENGMILNREDFDDNVEILASREATKH